MKKLAIVFLLLLATSTYAKDKDQPLFPALPPLPIQAIVTPPSNPTSYTFAVAGDNRPDKCCAQPPELAKVIAAIKSKSPAFVLWDGDTIKGKDAASAPKEYAGFLAAFNGFGIPLYNSPGNHELAMKGSEPCGCDNTTDAKGNKKPKKIDQPDFTNALLNAYTTSYKTVPYGMFTYGNALFLAINTDDTWDLSEDDACAYNGYVGKPQRDALKETLKHFSGEPSITHIFLFMHRPLHDLKSSGKQDSHQLAPCDGKWKTKYGSELQKFIDLVSPTPLSPYPYPKITFIFASHDHRYYAFPPGTLTRTAPSTAGPTFLITGGAGAPLAGCPDKPDPGAYYNYLLVNVNGSTVTVTVQQLSPTCG